jgi:hypothetical protein
VTLDWRGVAWCLGGSERRACESACSRRLNRVPFGVVIRFKASLFGRSKLRPRELSEEVRGANYELNELKVVSLTLIKNS